jgi:hypothetical protein
MNRYGSFFLALVLLLTPGNHALVWSQEKVLVPGDPALTQNALDDHTALLQATCGFKLANDGRQTFQQLVMDDWKKADRAARDAFFQQLRDWKKASQRGAAGRSQYAATILPRYIDRQGDDGTWASDRWIVETAWTAYKKVRDLRPTAVVKESPPPVEPTAGEYGFPKDPKLEQVFAKPLVFTGPQVYTRSNQLTKYVSRDTGAVHHSYSYRWFLPTGREYARWVRCSGSTRVPGTEKDILISTYYLEGESSDEGWGRYTIDDKDRILIETDKGEKITVYLIYGRDMLIWDGTVYDAPPRKENAGNK